MENDSRWVKALLFIPNTEENIEFCEAEGNLSLITDEGIEVEVELNLDEDELIPSEMYDILRWGKNLHTNIAGEWLTLKVK